MDYIDIRIPAAISCSSAKTYLYLMLVIQSVTDFTTDDRADWFNLTGVIVPIWTRVVAK